MNPTCKACGNEFPFRRYAGNLYCSRTCVHTARRLTPADRLQRHDRHQRTTRPADFDPGMVAFLVAMIGPCVEHACATCECWRAMALAWLECRECRGVGAWV